MPKDIAQRSTTWCDEHSVWNPERWKQTNKKKMISMFGGRQSLRSTQKVSCTPLHPDSCLLEIIMSSNYSA